MSDDADKQAVADHGEPRLAVVADESKYVLSVDDAIARYKAAGISRIRRTVQRYCSDGTLDAHRFAIPYGEKYLITPESLDRHIKYILEAQSTVVSRGEPRFDMATAMPEKSGDVGTSGDGNAQNATVADHGEPRQAAAEDAPVAAQIEVVDILKSENKFLKEQIAVKDAQLAVKDRQIADQSERTRETNLLVASLHKLITPLLGRGDNSQHQGSRDSDGSNLGGDDYPPIASGAL